MTINNHGWGLNQMLILCAIILFFLLVAVFFILQLSNGVGEIFREIQGQVTYVTVEENVKSAASEYIEKYYHEEIGSGTITVTTNNLKEYNLLNESELQPSEEKTTCKGYALVSKENGELQFTPYIVCDHYATEGYQAWRLGE